MTGSPPEEPGASGSLLGSAVRQTGWSTLEKIGGQGLRFVVLVGLARLLVPSQFGLVTEAMIFTSLLGRGGALGLEPSLVQREEAEAADFSTVAWTSAAMAVALLVAAGLLGPVAAWIFGDDALRTVLPAMAVSTALRNLGLAPRARLRRKLDYRTLSLASVTGTAVGGGAGIGLAALGGGVWSLVVQAAVSSAVTVTWIWVAADVGFKRRFSRDRLAELSRFGAPFTGERLLNFVNRQADDLVIGVFLGEAALGLYRIAYMLLQAITKVLSGSVNAVALPVFSRAASDPSRLRGQFLQATELIALLALPACAGFAVVADLVIPALYGPRWAGAVPAARVLSFVALAHSVLLFSPTAMYALGRSDLQLRLAALYAGLNIVGFLVGVRWGIVGVAAAYAIQNLLTAPVELGVLNRLIDFRPGHYLEKFWRPVAATAVMVAALLGLRSVVAPDLVAELVLSVTAGILLYAGALLATGPSYLADLLRPLAAGFRR